MQVQFTKEQLTFTGEDSAISKLLLNVMGAFSEFERTLLRERQREGIAIAKKKGVYKGRKRSLNPEARSGTARADCVRGEEGCACTRIRH